MLPMTGRRWLALAGTCVALVACYVVLDLGLVLVVSMTVLGGFVAGLASRSAVVALGAIFMAVVFVFILDLARGRPNPFDDDVGIRLFFAFVLTLPAVPTAVAGAVLARRSRG
jgi:hypothetical protein